MHAMGPTKAAASPQAPANGLDPRILTAFEILGWNEKERAECLAANKEHDQAAILAMLNAKIDAQTEREGA